MVTDKHANELIFIRNIVIGVIRDMSVESKQDIKAIRSVIMTYSIVWDVSLSTEEFETMANELHSKKGTYHV